MTSQVTRRRSSGARLLPLIGALGELGKSESFTLRTPSQPAAPMRQQLDRRASCPNLGVDLADSPRSSSTSLNMIPSMQDMPSFNLADAAASLLSDNTDAQAEGMNFMSHALLDFPGAVAQAAVAAKAAEVAGRLFILGQGMLPGHEMMQDELAFQVGFLAVSCHALYQTVMPKIKASQASKFLTPGDRKAFRSVFKPAGMSWDQYRELSIDSMEWVKLEPGQAIEQDDAYWLYQGDVEVEGEEGPVSSGLLGEAFIAKTLGLVHGESIASKAAVAGAAGATVLKMSTQKLKKKISSDRTLQAPMNRMIFNTMQEKIESAHAA